MVRVVGVIRHGESVMQSRYVNQSEVLLCLKNMDLKWL